MKTRLLVLCCVQLFIISFLNGQVKKLKIGAKAPALTIQEWIKGTPVPAFEKDRLYIVEFSGTWCAPCLKAIPHLTELAKKYAGKIDLISVYTENNDKSKPTDLKYIEKVRALVNKLGDKMDFRVAVDVPQQTTKENWHLDGAGYTFIVDGTGKIVWTGTPTDLEPALQDLFSGNFNSQETLRQQEAFRGVLDTIYATKEKGNYRKALSMLDSLIRASNANKKPLLYYSKFRILAGADHKQAYEWLQWLLDSKVEAFDWPHFVGEFNFHNISPANRNYELELKAIDRNIEEAETTIHVSYSLLLKAKTYDKMGKIQMAADMFQKAVEYTRSSGADEKVIGYYEKELILYQYSQKQKVNGKEANAWLMEMIAKKKITVDIGIINAVLRADKPDIDLAVALIDTAVRNLPDEEINKPNISRKKAELLISKGDYKKAIEAYRDAFDFSQRETRKYIDGYEKKIAELIK